MIDKLEIRVPARAPYTKEFRRLHSEVPGDRKRSWLSRYYRVVRDLRIFGYQSILHAHCVYGSKGDHKLELIDTGRLTLAQMSSEIERVFDCDPRLLEVMRVDLAADVVGVPVSWFARNTSAKRKQWSCDIGKMYPVEYAGMGKLGVQTFYLGKRPNCFRIYNKIAEWRYRYSQLLKRADSAEEIPVFEELFGYPSEGVIVTRVERQIGGGRVPRQLNTFGKLPNATSFDPFDSLRFSVPGRPEPQPTDYDFATYWAGTGLRSFAEQQGIHRLRRLLNSLYTRHAGRILKRFQDFLPADEGYRLDSITLYRLYQESVGRQVAAA